MEGPGSTRKRRQGPGQPAKPPARLSREKRRQQDGQNVRLTKGSSESSRTARGVGSERHSVEDDPNAKSFTVGNVGRNGTVYLKPNRASPVPLSKPLATPPGTAESTDTSSKAKSGLRESTAPEPTTTTGYPFKLRGSAFNSTAPIPLPSIADVNTRGRGRSHSFSTIDDAVRASIFELPEVQILLDNQKPRQRSMSSIDLSQGLLNMRIPHYRLGTPRFSDMGTAYLHNSLGSAMTEDMRSSNTSRPDYDRFPAPPGRHLGMSLASSQRSNFSFLHPSQAGSFDPSRNAPQSAPRAGGGINMAMYDHVEANINSPSLVRYSTKTGRIIAATPARLLSQITSPWFLDYELLSDFFLTYRNFLSRHDLLNYLIVRMKWALANDSDSGRIVVVRTFVALRHWILNYFADDFIPDPNLRQRLCDRVNEIGHALQQRPDGGGGNLNVIGELKKCWRRICALFWSVEDLSEASPETDIVPGEAYESTKVRASATSLAQSDPRYSTHMDFRRSSVIPLPVLAENPEHEPTPRASGANRSGTPVRMASIPTSPKSEQSMTVLSCSVPFLKNLVSNKEKSVTTQSPEPRKESSEKSASATRRRKRSGSFSDALRDDRAPMSSGVPESVDFRSLPTLSFTGGLVRGLVLQPSPSNVELLIPISPPIEPQDFDFGFNSADVARSGNGSQQSGAGVKKIVGDVRRALSSRKRDSPVSSHRSTSSSESRNSGHSDRGDRPFSLQRLQGPPRVDMLGAKIGNSYRETFQGIADPETAHLITGSRASNQNQIEREELFTNQHDNRSHSHVTAGSRSIVIVDDTGVPDLPGDSGDIPVLAPRNSDFPSQPISIHSKNPTENFQYGDGSRLNASPAGFDEAERSQSMEPPIHDLLSVPESWQGGVAISDDGPGIGEARKSSSAHPPALDMPPIYHQLRRRPGGDLKANDRVLDLQPMPRPSTADSSSAFSQAIFTSGVPSVDLSGMRFSTDAGSGVQLPRSYVQGRKKESWTLLPTHSSQPNMRASMKERVSHLAQLPDDNSEGGIEDTLAKLEGKAASPTASTHGIAEREIDRQSSLRGALQVANPSMHIDELTSAESTKSPRTDRQGASIYHMSDDTQFDAAANARALDPKARVNNSNRDLPIQDVQLSDSAEEGGTSMHINEGINTSAESERTGTQRSHPVLDDDALSDISSEMEEDEPVEGSVGAGSLHFDDTLRYEMRVGAPFRMPPTPPSTTGGPVGRSGGSSPVAHRTGHGSKQLSQGTNTLRNNATPDPNSPGPSNFQHSNLQNGNAHLPFVLAFESDVIAEQLTIIEKDALDEVDWKDLIALNWQHAPLHIRNWVEFLKRSDCNGIDMVVSRFNLVVKWVVSECVLTEVPSERAKCITKYIHIAAHAHRLRNYSTMYQITLALLSSDMARLHKSWPLVPAAERQLLKQLEKLCNPRGNFHQLRAEMESASAEDACIPFIGLWTHDLMFNAQKPSRIESTLPKGERLINFERFQTAATLVKSLLTLIESSSKYVFRPHPEVLSRCLWLAALEDDEITARSKMLEK